MPLPATTPSLPPFHYTHTQTHQYDQKRADPSGVDCPLWGLVGTLTNRWDDAIVCSVFPSFVSNYVLCHSVKLSLGAVTLFFLKGAFIKTNKWINRKQGTAAFIWLDSASGRRAGGWGLGGDSATLMACVMTDMISVACGRLEVITYGNLEKGAVRSETDVTLTV